MACTELKGQVTQLAKGVYCVTGDVIVPAGATLDIPPGTEFIVKGRYHFGRDPALPDGPDGISGGLRAVGTAAEPIVFRGETAETGWFGLAVSHSSEPVHLEYVVVRDTYKDDPSVVSRIWRRGGALSSYVNEKGTIIRHSSFIHNRAWMVGGALDINSHGTWPDLGPVEITDSLFEDNSCECGTLLGVGGSEDSCGGGAIRFVHVGGPTVKIERNLFRNNHAYKTAGYATFGGALGAFSTQIRIGPGNLFEGNSSGVIDGAISCGGQPSLGVNFTEVDPSNRFLHNAPDIGCGLKEGGLSGTR